MSEMRKLTLLLFASATTLVSYSQESFTEQLSHELTQIPFTQFTGGIIVLKARLEGIPDSLNFILDSGSGGISLDSTTVTELGLNPSEPERIIRGIGGTRKVGFVKNKTLIINQLAIDSLNFHVLNYEVLSALYGERIDGIIGYSVLSRYIVKVDYEKRILSFWSNGAIRYPRGGLLLKPRITRLPYLFADIRDEKQRRLHYLFDIGAGLTLLLSDDYVTDSTLLKSKRKKYLKQGEGLGGKVDFYLTVIKEVKIGAYKFRNVPVNIFDDEYNITSYPSSGGIIGNDIFRRFNCILNYDKKEIHLKPNKFFSDPFDYAYSGIELYRLDGKVIIGDIPKGSPADKAGLMAGDEVVAVNKKFGMTLNDFKQALQSTYGPVDILINRAGELFDKRMRVINIMNGKAISNQSVSNEFRDGIIIRINQDPTRFNR